MAACQTTCSHSGGHQARSRLTEAASSGEVQAAAFVDLKTGSDSDSHSSDTKQQTQ